MQFFKKILISPVSIAMIVCPTLFLVALQSFNSSRNIFGSAVLGLLVGFLFFFVFYKSFPSFFEEYKILKVVTFLSPIILFFGFMSDRGRTNNFYSIFIIIFFVLVYLSFMKSTSTKTGKIALFIFLASLFYIVLYCIIVMDSFTPDSYSYYELSKTIFSNFYKISTHRQYVVSTDYGISFPYMYPLFISIVDFFTGLGIYSGTIINILAALFSSFLLYKISKKLFNMPIIGAIALFFLLCNPSYLDEVSSARSIPVGILFTLMILYKLLYLPNLSKKNSFIVGIVSGIALMIRFDAIVVIGCAFMVIFIFSKNKRISNCLMFLLGSLIFALPWILFSLIIFNKIWITDNSGTALLTTPLIPQRYSSSEYTLPTFFTDTSLWVRSFFEIKLANVSKGFIRCVVEGGGGFFILWVLFNLILGIKNSTKKFFSKNKRTFIIFVTIGIAYLLKTIMLLLVGYKDARYHIETWFFIVLFLTFVVFFISKKNMNIKNVSAMVIVVCILVQMYMVPVIVKKEPKIGKYLRTYARKNDYIEYVIREELLNKPGWAIEMYNLVTSEVTNPRVLFLIEEYPYQFGAHTGITTFSRPRLPDSNLDPKAIYELTDTYVKPDFIVAEVPIDEEYAITYKLFPMRDFGEFMLYRVESKLWE